MRFRIILFLAAASSAFAQMGMMTTGGRMSSFPPVGLAGSETAQVNVANVAAAVAGLSAPSCSGTIAFVNDKGATIGAAASFTVGSGQTFSKALPYANTAASGRTIVRAVITLTTDTTGAIVPCSLATSFETFDTNTGVTHVYLSDGGMMAVSGFLMGHGR